MPCPSWFPSRPVLRWRSVLSGAAPGLHMSLLWQDGLHRDLPAGARGCRAHRDLHRSGMLVLKHHTHSHLDVCADLNNRKHLHFCWFFLACLRISSQLSKLHPLLRTSLTLEEPVGFESMLSRVYILFAVLVLMSASDSVRKPNCNWCQVDCAALFIEAPCFSSDSKKTLVWTAEKYFVHVL